MPYKDPADRNAAKRRRYAEDKDRVERWRRENPEKVKAMQARYAKKLRVDAYGERPVGRPRLFDDEQVADMKAMAAGGMTHREIASVMGCALGTVHTYLNPKERERRQQWNRDNRDYIREWQRDHPAQNLHYRAIDRLTFLGRGDEPMMTREEFEAIYYAATECGDCTVTLTTREFGQKVPATQKEQHHILPLSLGGGHTADNIVVLCHSCHKRWDFAAGV